MDKKLLIILAAFLVVASGLVYAADKNVSDEKMDVKNMTYGQCVSENAVIKNSCYASVKSALRVCRDEAEGNAAEDDMRAECKQDYKKDKRECKAVFKASKVECKKIKHNFFETVRWAFA